MGATGGSERLPGGHRPTDAHILGSGRIEFRGLFVTTQVDAGGRWRLTRNAKVNPTRFPASGVQASRVVDRGIRQAPRGCLWRKATAPAFVRLHGRIFAEPPVVTGRVGRRRHDPASIQPARAVLLV